MQAALKRHPLEVTEAVERVCAEQRGCTHPQMAEALITAFLAAKMRDARTSVALYSVSSDLDAAKIVREMGARNTNAIAAMLASAREPGEADPQLMASMPQGAMNGVSRRLLESDAHYWRVSTLRLVLSPDNWLQRKLNTAVRRQIYFLRGSRGGPPHGFGVRRPYDR